MKIQFCLIDSDYIENDGKAVIRLWGKTKDRKSVCVLYNYEPYFYVLPKSNIEKTKKQIEKVLKGKELKIKSIKTEEKMLFGKKQEFLKIFCFLPQDVPKIRDIVKKLKEVKEEYEYSINFYKRFLIDKQISGLDWIEVEGKEIKKDYLVDLTIQATRIKKIENKVPSLKTIAFDIESLEQAGKQKIIMLSVFGKNFKKVITYRESKYGKHVEVVKNEKELLERFMEIIREQDPDIILTFNGDEFDFSVLRKRVEEYKIKLVLSRDESRMKFARRARISSAKIKGRVHVDLFNFINNILSPQLQTEVLTLDAVSSEILGDSKIQIQYEEILKAWKKKKDLGKLAEYCLKDSELTFRLGEFLLPEIYELSRLTGQLAFDVSRMTYSQLVESYLTKKAFVMKEIIPNQPKWNEIQERRMKPSYIGGYVKEPLPGIHENIAVMDFRSLYPSIIASFNISPETLNCGCKNVFKTPKLKYCFCKKDKGFVSISIKELIEERMKIKSKMKSVKEDSEKWNRLNAENFSLKTLANASYGYYAFPGSKWYCYECAESAADFGRFYIKQVIKDAEKDFIVIYVDTDSCFVKLKEKGNLNKKIKEFLNEFNKKLPGILELDLQGIYKRGIFIPRGIGPGTAKKRYALIDEKGNLTIRGLETVRKDWCFLAKQVQRRVLEYVLEKKDVNSAIKYVQKIIQELRERKVLLRDLIIYEQLTKSLSEYKAIGPHVAVARKIKERGEEIGEGMIVMFVITKGKGSISERAEPVENVEIKDIDINYYVSNQIVPAALRILTVLGVDEKQLLGQSLKRFLK